MAEMNPQRLAFKEYYCNPASDTFNLIYESAIKAGFSESYSKVLMSKSTSNNWVKNIIKNYKLKSLAEKNLEKLLKQKKNLNIQADMTKFTLKTLGKDEYSERSEITGADGKDLTIQVIKYGDDNNSLQLPTENLPDTTTESN